MFKWGREELKEMHEKSVKIMEQYLVPKTVSSTTYIMVEIKNCYTSHIRRREKDKLRDATLAISS